MNRIYTLYCGGKKPTGEASWDSDFREVRRDVVTPRFPGFTVRTGVGYWNGVAETVREIVIDGLDSDRYLVFEIARRYAARFEQESVLVTTVETTGAFVS